MTRDARTYHFDDPAHRWSAQLEGLFGRRREAVIRALRNSIDSGHPADAEGVRILVAYARGQISARQYVAQILASFGFAPVTAAPVVRQPEPWRTPARQPVPWTDALYAPLARSVPAPSEWHDPWRDSWTDPVRAPERRDGTTITQSRRTSRQQAVQAYVTGQIPVEEFLRIWRVHTA